MKRNLLAGFSLAVLISCNSNEETYKGDNSNNTIASTLKEMGVQNDVESGSVGFVLFIQKTEKISPELTAYKLVSMYKEMPVGFTLVIEQPIKRTEFVADGASFLAMKDTSNNFLKALSEIYGISAPNAVFKDSITITYADLEAMMDVNKPGNWVAAQKKLFFQTEDDSPELFMDIDEKAGTITFSEKDKEYREGIITAMSRKLK